MEPVQKTSVDIKIKPGENLPEPFVTALERRKFEIIWMDNKNTYTFFCRHYEADATYDTPPGAGGVGVMTGEWLFYDVLMDTSKRDLNGKVTLIRMTYHPQISLVNIPFMVLPAEGEKSEIHIPEDVNVLPSDEDVRDRVD